MTHQLSFADTGEGITGQYMMKQAEEFIQKNPYLWNWMLGKAAQYVAEDRRFSMETLIQEARYNWGRVESTDKIFKINNNIRAALCRKMLEKYPSWEKYVDKRQSKVDWV